MITIRTGDLVIEARPPTLSDLTKWKKGSQEDGGKADALKKLARACVVRPGFGELVKAKPAAPISVAGLLLKSAGIMARVDALDEDEVDEDMAKALAEAERKGFRDLVPVLVQCAEPAFEYRLILRGAKEREVDAVSASETFEAYATFIRTICVWSTAPGEKVSVDLDRTHPAAYAPLASFAMERAGLLEDFVLGEA